MCIFKYMYIYTIYYDETLNIVIWFLVNSCSPLTLKHYGSYDEKWKEKSHIYDVVYVLFL